MFSNGRKTLAIGAQKARAFQIMKAPKYNEWEQHQVYKNCECRFLNDDDQVIDSIMEGYPEALPILSEHISKATLEKPCSMSIFGPISSDNGINKTVVFFNFLKVEEVKESVTGYVLIEIRYPARLDGFIDCAKILTEISAKFKEGMQ